MRADSSPAEINIGDVLRLALPIDATLIGGGVEARRYVNWIAILTTWEDFDSQVEPNDLVIIPPQLQAKLNADDAEPTMRAMADYPVAGLVCFGRLEEGTMRLV